MVTPHMGRGKVKSRERESDDLVMSASYKQIANS
jgi:hypothetical protein